MRNPLTRVSDRYVPTPIPLDALEPTEVRDCYRLGPSIIAPGTDRGTGTEVAARIRDVLHLDAHAALGIGDRADDASPPSEIQGVRRFRAVVASWTGSCDPVGW
jgi:hypothetical protein